MCEASPLQDGRRRESVLDQAGSLERRAGDREGGLGGVDFGRHSARIFDVLAVDSSCARCDPPGRRDGGRSGASGFKTSVRVPGSLQSRRWMTALPSSKRVTDCRSSTVTPPPRHALGWERGDFVLRVWDRVLDATGAAELPRSAAASVEAEGGAALVTDASLPHTLWGALLFFYYSATGRSGHSGCLFGPRWPRVR